MLKPPAAGSWDTHLLSPEISDMVMHSLKRIESFEDPFPYLSELA